MPISKTDFVRGLQCPKMLWLDAHKPELRVIPPEVQQRLDQGNEFGDKAMGIFGKFVETTTFREDGRLFYAEMIRKTKTLLDAGENVICEAAFSWYGNYCAADILKKEAHGYVLYEVKNAPDVRKEFILDLAFQQVIIRNSGVPLLAAKLILRGDEDKARNATKNTEEGGQGCVEYKNYDGFTYKIVDVSAAVRAMERSAKQNVFLLGKLKTKDAECPIRDTGEHCQNPYACWYYDYCKKN